MGDSKKMGTLFWNVSSQTKIGFFEKKLGYSLLCSKGVYIVKIGGV